MKKQSAQPHERISKKEVYSRLVSLESKMDFMRQESRESRKQFTTYVFIMVSLMLLDLLITVLTFVRISK